MFVTRETEIWLGPLINAQFCQERRRRVRVVPCCGGLRRRIKGREVDWVQVGQLIRNELGWDDYRAFAAERFEVLTGEFSVICASCRSIEVRGADVTVFACVATGKDRCGFVCPRCLNWNVKEGGKGREVARQLAGPC